MSRAELVLRNGRIFTGVKGAGDAAAVAIGNGLVLAVGSEQEVHAFVGPDTRVIDLDGRRVIPGLNDSHIHMIRGGLNFHLELRWDGISSLAEALRRLREQAQRTPAPQWVRVVGGFSEFQFRERRMPTLSELNQAAPDTPVFILNLYGSALLNGAALRAVGYTSDSPDPPGGRIERDRRGNPTGLLLAKPNALILYSTLAKGPKLGFDDQLNSTRHFMRELNRLGVTSVIDAGGGFQSFPEDYEVVERLHRAGQLTLRVAYNLFTQHPKEELSDFEGWSQLVSPGQGDSFYRMNGAGEMLVFSAADFENFLEPRPELNAGLEQELYQVVRLLSEKRWPFRLHATYDESIQRFLDVFERVNREVPFDGLRWWFDHAETISEASLERTRALGGGIAIQDRMAFQGEHFIARYGKEAARKAPPVKRMRELGIPVGAGTDATRVASYNPWVALYWLVSGRTVGGTQLNGDAERLQRSEALEHFTSGSAWFSGEEQSKGKLLPGQFADLAVLSADYFKIAEDEIKQVEAVLTVVDGKIVHGSGSFGGHAPVLPPVSPSWSAVATYGGYPSQARNAAPASRVQDTRASCPAHALWGAHGCDCFAF